MTSLSVPGGYVCSLPRESSNTAWDFLKFAAELVFSRFLTTGDTLVLDNARIHYAAAIVPHLNALLLTCGIHFLFLPSYSPELNPCEMVFSHIKRHLRANRHNAPLLVDMLLAMSTVTNGHVLMWYDHCIHRPGV